MVKYLIDEDVRLPPCGTNGGKAKAANSQVRFAMPQIYGAYQAWKTGVGVQYSGNPDFAGKMCEVYEIKEIETILKRVRKWEKGVES